MHTLVMTPVQLATLRVQDPNMARALQQDSELLRLFVFPRSPTEAAQKAGMAANLAHHHVRRLSDLGLLFEQRREGGKVFYQLTAREFIVPSLLLPPANGSAGLSEPLGKLVAGFTKTYERSWAKMHAGDEGIIGFGEGCHKPQLDVPLHDVSDEPYPAHLEHLTLRLSPQRFRALAHALSALLRQTAAEGHSEGGQHCTFAVLAFQDSLVPPGTHLVQGQDSFLGAQP